LAEAHELIPEIDAGNYVSLIALVRTSVARYSGMNDTQTDQASPICVHGGILPADLTVPYPVPSARMLGEWILAVIDAFLEMPRSFAHFASMDSILEALGWPDELIHLLFKGRPTFRLVKPTASIAEPKVVEYSDPYWFWLRFHGGKAGWLNPHDVRVLLDVLDRDRERLLAFDVQRLKMNGIHLEDPIVREEFSCGIQGSLDFFLERLALAATHKKGVFQSLIYIQ
jgi:hypothetical protein